MNDLKMGGLEHSRHSGFGPRYSPLILLPPYKQEILDYLVLKSILSRGILQEFKRFRYSLGLEVGDGTLAKS